MPDSHKETRQTIMVVDDNAAVLNIVVKILEAESFRVLSASSAAAAIQFAKDTDGTIDLLLSDVDMAGMSGPDLGEALKKSRPDIHVMLMSGGPNGNLLVLNDGWAYIQKPLVAQKLTQMIRDVLGSPNRSQSGGKRNAISSYAIGDARETSARPHNRIMRDSFRIERDTMGDMQVPSSALYGPQTARAVQNFPISGKRFPRSFIRALGMIKSAAATTNGRMGHLPPALAAAIEAAAEQVVEGRYDNEFPIDVFQTGSGTSTNMNANEVIGHLAGAHPNDHVNRGQSSNDVIPTAMHIAVAECLAARLLPAMRQLGASLDRKAVDFHDIIKIGRTHLQDAVPIRMGQEFSGYARQVKASRERIEAALPGIYELPLGGTAVGTGLNAPPGFARGAIAEIVRRTGLPFVEAHNHFEAQAARDAACFLSGALRTYAVALTKIANDIRWLGSGPRCGLGELKLPAVQPGSSIMPGKVNPVIAESLLMVCAQVIGYDSVIVWCSAAGNFELNVMMTVMVLDLLDAIELLAAGTSNFAEKLVDGLEADQPRAEGFVEQSLAMGTALTSEIGYEEAAVLAKEAHATGRTIRDVARDKSGIPEERLDSLLNPQSQVGEQAEKG